jgi:hypothetical protein
MADSKGGHGYSSPTWYKRLVAEYTGLNFLQIKELNYLEFLTYRRDAFIAYLNKSEAGQEYLRNAWRMEQTEPDRAALRRRFGGKEALNSGQQ